MIKYLLALFLIIPSLTVSAQDLVTYTDTTNHFSIGIPEGWRYMGSTEPSIKLIVRRPPAKGDTLVENYNINIIPWANINLEISFSRIYLGISEADNFKLVDSGSLAMNEKDFKWLIEHHTMTTPQGVRAELYNYVFVAYYNNHTYVLTMVAPVAAFEKHKPLLRKISESFKF